MNKKIIGISIAMLFAANGAMAQSTSGTFVEMYGVLDASIAHINHSLSTSDSYGPTLSPGVTSKAVNNSVTGMVNGAFQASRWGIRGSEDLGNGFKAIFDLSSLINIQSGRLGNAAQSLADTTSTTSGPYSSGSSVNGELFNNQAFAGLQSATWGKLTFGRQLTGMSDIVSAYDAVQGAAMFSPVSYSGAISGGTGVTDTKRQNSSLKYTNKMGDFNFGAMYRIGGVAGKTSAMSGWGLWGGYDANGLGVQAAYQRYTDALREANPTTTLDTLRVTNYNADAWMLAAKYVWGDFKFVGGFEEYKLKQPSDLIATLGINSINGFPISTATNFAGTDQKTRIWWLGGDYNFSPAMNLALGVYNVAPRASASIVGGTAGQLEASNYYYSGLLDYKFTKRTDVYGGVMFSHFGGAGNANNNSSNYVYAFGMRTKF